MEHGRDTPSTTLLGLCCAYRTHDCVSSSSPSATLDTVTSLLRFFFPGFVRSSASVSDRVTIFRFFSVRACCFLAGTWATVAACSLSEPPSRSSSSAAILFLTLTLRTRALNEERYLKIVLSSGVWFCINFQPVVFRCKELPRTVKISATVESKVCAFGCSKPGGNWILDSV